MNTKKLAQSKSFLAPILTLVIMAVIIVTIVITYININIFTHHMQQDIETKKAEYLAKNKQEVYNKVHSVNQSIEFQITRIETKLKKYLKERIETSLSIAHYMYNKLHGTVPDEEIKRRIVKHLGSIRFNEGRGYYFIYDNKTNIMLGHIIKKFIKFDMTNMVDKKGQNLIQVQKDALKDSKIGFAKIYFNKPNDHKNEYLKITAVTNFEPLDMIIGTGEYLDIVEKQIKGYVIDRFNNSKSNQNYLFFLDIHNLSGGDNFATMILNSNRKDLVGKQISDSYKGAKGKEFRKEFLEGIRQNGEAFTKYWYKKPDTNEPKPKMSYFYHQKDWNWILASGFYYDDLEHDIAAMKDEISQYTNETIINSLITIFITSIITIIIAAFVSLRIDRTIQKYTDEIVDFKEKQRDNDKLIAEQSKMVQMGEMIGNIAHQWRQPLSVISTSASGMQLEYEMDMLDKQKFQTYTGGIIKNTEYLSKTIDTFRDYIKEDKELKEVILQDRITSTIDIVEASITSKFIKLDNFVHNCETIKVTIVSDELSQVIINLINNAKDSLLEQDSDDKTIIISLTKEKNNAVITVEDNGGGIPQEILSKIFDPYFTTKHQSLGTGLGLHMSRDIIENHLNGTLTASNTSNGAKFTIELPIQ